MIFVQRIDPNAEPLSSELREWRRKASAATQEIINASGDARGTILQARSAVWQGLKPYLIWLFHEKCAFCESKFRAVSFGDVEHFRPKRGVKDDPVHPGYYWLAFDEINLLPSCERCNRNSKGNHFPIRGRRATHPGSVLHEEEPFLINPCETDPAAHLDFGTSIEGQPTGMVQPLTEFGERTIKIFNLNREELVESRRREQEAFINRILLLFARREVREIAAMFAENPSKGEPYTAACLAAGRELIDDFHTRVVGPMRTTRP